MLLLLLLPRWALVSAMIARVHILLVVSRIVNGRVRRRGGELGWPRWHRLSAQVLGVWVILAHGRGHGAGARVGLHVAEQAVSVVVFLAWRDQFGGWFTV